MLCKNVGENIEMADQDRGEHSRKPDDKNDEKPMKKAKYEWQVKGKHHLKETNGSSSGTKVNNNEESDDGILTAKRHKKGETCHCIIMENSEDEDWVSANDVCDIPVTLVNPNVRLQEYLLHKWQTRRLARGFVDNTINTILENWKSIPVNFDASDLVENCENGGQVEDEGILMAIQSHGLQPSFSNPLRRYRNGEGSLNLHVGEMSRFDNIRFDWNAVQDQLERARSAPENHKNDNKENEENKECDNSQVEDPMEFLNAAVSAAIEKKGLSSF